MDHKSNEVTFVAISGINYPTNHRQYLLKLMSEVAIKHKVPFVVIAGNTVDGKALAREYSVHLKHDLDGLKAHTQELTHKAKAVDKLIKKLNKRATKAEVSNRKNERSRAKTLRTEAKNLQKEVAAFLKEAESFEEESFRDEFHDEFVERHAQELKSLLPEIPDVNYHIAIAQDVYDLQMGVEILERLAELREDIRLIGIQEDGTYDPEPKIPSLLKGFEEIRVVLPKQQPWYYKIISGFMQRLINGFVGRTQSPKPDLLLVGCTGTAVYLPYYEGVPCISVPTLHKLNEQRSTENMVACTVIKVVVEKDRKRIIWGNYDLRPAIFNERSMAIPNDASPAERSVLLALASSPASFKTIVFRNYVYAEKNSVEHLTQESILQVLQKLIQKKMVLFNKKSNQYAISESYLQQTDVSLEKLFKVSKTLRETVTSCFHCGCLKTLYNTNLHYLPVNAADSDILVENGDGIQGIAHAYEYNGELLPTMIAYDKQELTLAAVRRKNILDIFSLRLAKHAEEFKKSALKAEEIVERCVITYIFQAGNHSGWKYFQKHTLILGEFENSLKAQLVDGLLALCREAKLDVSHEYAKSLVDRKVIRVGESFMVQTHGFAVAIKHPYKARTENKSHRIQDVINFIWREFFGFVNKVLQDKSVKGFVLADVANFHEAAAAHVSKFGRTALGVMTGAQVKDTRFESHLDKVVDQGTANVLVVKNEDDRLLYSEVEFDNRMHPADEKICFADKIMTDDVLDLCKEINKEAKLPWRY